MSWFFELIGNLGYLSKKYKGAVVSVKFHDETKSIVVKVDKDGKNLLSAIIASEDYEDIKQVVKNVLELLVRYGFGKYIKENSQKD